MTRVFYELDGALIAGYAPLPAGAEQLSEEQYLEALHGLSAPAPETLEELKDRFRREVDAAAEVERLRYITPGTGQAMTYQAKVKEVEALAQDAEPDPANYPLLSSEIGITAPSLTEVATVVFAAYQQWQQIGAAIERARLGTKAEIDAAETREDAISIASTIVWPAP